MKNKLPFLMILMTILINGCGGSNNTTSVQLKSEWILDKKTYTEKLSEYSPSVLIGHQEDIEIPAISVSSTLEAGIAALNTPGSSIIIQFTRKGEGIYKIGRDEDLLFSVNDPAKKIVTIGVRVMSDDTTITTWAPEALTTNTVTVTIDNQGKYHFTTNNTIKLEQQFYEFPNTPEPIEFSMTNIFLQN